MRLLQTLIIPICIWSISEALPLNEAQKIRKRLAPRAKTYSIVNVGGDAPTPAETVVETVALPAPVETETIRVTDVAPPVATITVVPISTPEKLPSLPPAPSITTTSASYSMSSSCRTSVQTTSFPTSSTAAPSIISSSTVTPVATTSQASSTGYPDDGMWHTKYPAKTFDTVSLNATATSTPLMEELPSSLVTTSPVSIPTLPPSYNQTYPIGRLRVRSRLAFS